MEALAASQRNGDRGNVVSKDRGKRKGRKQNEKLGPKHE